MHSRLVFLVPGFFGFTSVGAVSYFERVEHTLRRSLRRRGIEARILRCRTQPTASIPQPGGCLATPGRAAGAAWPRRSCTSSATPPGAWTCACCSPRREDLARRYRRAHRPPHAQRRLGGHAAPRHAAGQSLPEHPGPDAAAGAERAGHLGPGPRHAAGGGEGGGAGGAAGRLAGPRRGAARPHCRCAAAPHQLRPARPGVGLPRRDRARPGCGDPAHPGRHRAVRRGRGRPRAHRLRLHRRGRAQAARAVQGRGTVRSGVRGAARLLQAAARVGGAPASALPVSEAEPGDAAKAASAPWASRSRPPPTTASCRA